MTDKEFQIVSKVDNIVYKYCRKYQKDPKLLLLDFKTWNKLLMEADPVLKENLQEGRHKGMDVLLVIEPCRLVSREIIICGNYDA